MKWRFDRSEEDFEEEIRSHIEHETDRLVAEGMSARAARKAAYARFGHMNAARDHFRSARRLPRLELILKDAALALRGLLREPAFAVVAILTLGVGIGINSAIFTLLYSLTKRPLALPESDRLVTVHQQFGTQALPSGRMYGATIKTDEYSRAVNGSPDMASYAEYQHFRARRGFDGLAAFAAISLTMEGDPPTAARGTLVSCNYFDVLRVQMQRGRSFAAGECARAGDVPAVVLSDGLWQRNFGADPSIVGRTIVLNRQAFTVIGVAQKKFAGTELEPADLWLPVTMQPLLAPDQLRNENMSWLNLVGRLSRGASIGQARSLLTQAAHQRDADYPGRETTVHVYAATRVPRAQIEDQINIINLATISIASLIVLIACLNVANLLLTRAPARQRTVRIRLSLGADRRQVIAQLLIESLVLALLGGMVGLALSMWIPPLVISLLPVSTVDLPFTPDARVLGYTLLVSALAAIVFGLVPALEAARVDLASAMRGDAAGAGRGPRSQRLRQSVVAAQLAGSLLLLVIAGLFARSLSRAKDIDPGYRIEGVLAFKPDLQRQGYTPARAQEFLHTLQARVALLPEVDAAALGVRLPLQGRMSAPFQRGAEARSQSESEGVIDFTVASAGYFGVLGIPLIRGELYSDAEPRSGDVVPAVITERMAAQFWPGQEALQQNFLVGGIPYRVVGIARDTRHVSLNEPDKHFFYAPVRFAVNSTDGMAAIGRAQALIVHTTNPRGLPARVVQLARSIDPAVLLTTESLAGNIAEELQGARLVALFAGILGFLALLLAVIGVYSAVAYGVNQRLHEIGLRYALGATRRDIVQLVLRQGRTPLVVGILVGLLLALSVGLLLRGAFYGFEPIDPLTFLGMTLLLVAAALLAMVRPARRAAAIDPALTLRRD